MCATAPLSSWAQNPTAQNKPTPVIVSTIAETSFVDEVEALGTLRANESVDLTSTVTELVTQVNFEDGQRVKKGDLLIQMNASEELAELAEENSRLAEAKRQVNRLNSLAATNAATESALDAQRSEVETAKARIQAIQSRVAQRTIVAPFDGVVGLRNISIGALAQPGTRITTIDDDTIMKLDFAVPARFLSVLQPGVTIEARARSYPDKVFSGNITSIDSRIDPVTRSIQVRAIIDNPDRLLKPGLLMRVTLQTNPRQTLVVPEEALTAVGDKSFVYVVKQDQQTHTVEQRSIKIGARRAGEAEVLSGLSASEQVVVHGTVRIRPGAAVKIVAEEKGDQPLQDLIKTEAGGVPGV
ncbi:efflux RND transporter periplasmic adaptor subunit [Marinicella sp. W31]|uniref:efflux RND transporter periplasmic adaptor subunit n=1 Tax=Marinicella sp. W31 TaxID=3023713 RepID=UPI0037566CA7